MTIRTLLLRSAACAIPLLLVVGVRGQSLNVDLDIFAGPPEAGNGSPSSIFGGAADQQGFWNRMDAAGPRQATPLAGLDGNLTSAMIQVPGGSGGAGGSGYQGNTGDYALLLNDYALAGRVGLPVHGHVARSLLGVHVCCRPLPRVHCGCSGMGAGFVHAESADRDRAYAGERLRPWYHPQPPRTDSHFRHFRDRRPWALAVHGGEWFPNRSGARASEPYSLVVQRAYRGEKETPLVIQRFVNGGVSRHDFRQSLEVPHGWKQVCTRKCNESERARVGYCNCGSFVQRPLGGQKEILHVIQAGTRPTDLVYLGIF